MLEHISEDGIIKLPMNISKAYGGTDSDTWGWALCDAPVNLYALAKIGLKDDNRIKSGVNSLAKLIRDDLLQYSYDNYLSIILKVQSIYYALLVAETICHCIEFFEFQEISGFFQF